LGGSRTQIGGPDEWMNALALDCYDEERRAKVEALQWKLAQQLLALALRRWIELFQAPTPEEIALFDPPLDFDQGCVAG
jgi:hypothetical protein